MIPSSDGSDQRGRRLGIALGIGSLAFFLLTMVVHFQARKLPDPSGPYRQSDVLGYDRATGATWVRCPACDPKNSRYCSRKALDTLDRGAGLLGVVRAASRGRLGRADRRMRQALRGWRGPCKLCQGKQYLTLTNPRIAR